MISTSWELKHRGDWQALKDLGYKEIMNVNEADEFIRQKTSYNPRKLKSLLSDCLYPTSKFYFFDQSSNKLLDGDLETWSIYISSLMRRNQSKI